MGATTTLRPRAQVVVIGGGVAGASIAYHLARLGWTDVVVLERDQLTAGSTFHSAGLVGQLRSSVTLTRMMMDGTELYRRLLAETGHDPGWREVGSLRLASSAARLDELRRQAGWAATFGLPLELVSPGRAHELFAGLFDLDGVLGAAHLPTDGHLNPSDLTMALAAGARAEGVEIATRTRVTGIEVAERAGRRQVRGVQTDHGAIECELVVNAGGIYSLEIGRLAGVIVPVVPMGHQYAITRPRVAVPRTLPTMRDPDRLVYFREEVGGLVVGGYERDPAPWCIDGTIPPTFNNQLLDPDWDRFAPLADAAQRLIPALVDADVVTLVNGPEAFTPDGEFILGETDVAGFFVAAGFCAHGIAGAGGVGKVMAEWIVGRAPPLDLWRMDVRRFGPQHASRGYCVARTDEIYRTYYDITSPHHERQAGRPLRVSSAYLRHLELGAVCGEKSGWERVNWYASNEDPGHDHLRPTGWVGEHWSTAIVTEHLATRRAAGLFDESSFAKLEMEGPGAMKLLEHLCANRVDRPVGSVTYTAMLNLRGGIECDLTVTRLGAERFLLVSGTAFGRHDRAWIEGHAPDDGSVRLRDITPAFACLALWGPQARTVLAEVCSDDLTFPYLQGRWLTVGDVPCWAQRVTYVGELGWELYPSAELGLNLWDTLLAAGRPQGLLPCGYRAIESLRLEKGYRAWGSDVTADVDPYSAGLGFAVRAGGRDFVGRDALPSPEGGDQRLACLVLDDGVVVGNEPVRSTSGTVVGRVTSGGYGYAVEASIAYAWLPADCTTVGRRLTVDVASSQVGATVAAEPLYDPTGARLRA